MGQNETRNRSSNVEKRIMRPFRIHRQIEQDQAAGGLSTSARHRRNSALCLRLSEVLSSPLSDLVFKALDLVQAGISP